MVIGIRRVLNRGSGLACVAAMALPVSPLRQWLTLAVLFATSVLAFLDRAVFVQLLVSIKTDLHLSDTQLGLLGGGLFALVQVAHRVSRSRSRASSPRCRFC